MMDGEHGGESATVSLPGGRKLQARLWNPSGGSDPAVVAVIAPALGVRQTFYGALASHLAFRGLGALTFDYRAIGASRGDASVRDIEGDLLAWGREDVRGVLDWVHESGLARGAYVAYLGHSIGIPLLGLSERFRRVDAVIAVAAPHAHWRHWSGRDRLQMWLTWHLVVPVVTRFLGYLPGRALGLGSDLPADVAQQWARWARHPDYVVDREGRPIRKGFERLSVPVLAVSSSEDHYSPPRAAEELLDFFVEARKEHRVLDGGALDLPPLEHLDFFRDPPGPRLWDEWIGWLRSVLPGLGRRDP